MNHHQVVILGFRHRLGRRVAVGWRVEQPCARNHSCRVGQPSRIPERPYFPRRLIARASASVEVVVGGRIQEQGLHSIHAGVAPAILSERLVGIYKRAAANAIIAPRDAKVVNDRPRLRAQIFIENLRTLVSTFRLARTFYAVTSAEGNSVVAKAIMPVNPPVIVAANHSSPIAIASGWVMPIPPRSTR